VHVVGIDRANPQPLIDNLGEKALEEADETGSIDHIAFVAQDLAGMKARFNAAGCAFREGLVPSMNLAQLFLEDPNGVTIELNSPAETTARGVSPHVASGTLAAVPRSNWQIRPPASIRRAVTVTAAQVF